MAVAPNGKKSAVIAVTNGAGANVMLVPSNDQRLSLIILNNSAGIVYLGNATGVTAANGLPIAAGASLTDTSSGDSWWVFSVASADMRCLETSGD